MLVVDIFESKLSNVFDITDDDDTKVVEVTGVVVAVVNRANQQISHPLSGGKEVNAFWDTFDTPSAVPFSRFNIHLTAAS